MRAWKFRNKIRFDVDHLYTYIFQLNFEIVTKLEHFKFTIVAFLCFHWALSSCNVRLQKWLNVAWNNKARNKEDSIKRNSFYSLIHQCMFRSIEVSRELVLLVTHNLTNKFNLESPLMIIGIVTNGCNCELC